jgi:hypothetical protein
VKIIKRKKRNLSKKLKLTILLLKLIRKIIENATKYQRVESLMKIYYFYVMKKILPLRKFVE